MHKVDCDVLVLGIGNLLWADEGFGVRCAEMLLDGWELPTGVTVMDGGTQGLYLLPYVQAARRLIVFDAIDYGLPPGTLKRVEGEEVPRFMGAKKMSLHQTGFQEVLAAAALTDQFPESLLLIGAQPQELDDYGGSLRPCVRACLAPAVRMALAQLRQWGHAPRPRDSEGDGQALASAPAARQDALAMDTYESGRPSAAAAARLGDARFFPAERPCA